MFGTFQAHGAAEVRDAVRETQRENAPRLAFSCHHQISTGVGHFQIEQPLMFDLPFLVRPHFAQGATVKTMPNLDEWGIPQGTATVWQWERNVKGHYIGAYLALSITIASQDGFYAVPPPVEMIHDLVFIGIGYKDLGPRVAVEAQLIGARPVGFGGNA